MLPASTSTMTIRTTIPGSISRQALLALMHDHKRYMDLDAHLEVKTKLGGETMSQGQARHTRDWIEQAGVTEWLVIATQDSVTDLEKTSNPPSNGEWTIEYWQIEIANPMGRVFGRMKYYASFINLGDGFQVIVEVPGIMGMRSWTRYHVHDSPGGSGSELVEDVRLECPVGLGGFTKKEIEKSHPETHRKIVDELSKGSN